MRDADLVVRLLAQNERLIEALVGSSPVEVIRALNPVAPQVGLAVDEGGPLMGRLPVEDGWGNPEVPDEVVLPGLGGWVTAQLDDGPDSREVDGE